MKTSFALLALNFLVGTITTAGCDVPPGPPAPTTTPTMPQPTPAPASAPEPAAALDPAAGQLIATEPPSAVAPRATPAGTAAAPVDDVPEVLRPDAITEVTTACAVEPDFTMATLRYIALRGDRRDSVVLSFRADNGYVHFNHTRNGQDLGTMRVDVVTGEDTMFAGMGQKPETETAYLMGELSPGLAGPLPIVQACINKDMNGEVTRDGEIQYYEPQCDFSYRILELVVEEVTGAAGGAAGRACCVASPSGLSCGACQQLAQAVTQEDFDAQNDSLQKQACEAQGGDDHLAP
jgi:hypothetical protein